LTTRSRGAISTGNNLAINVAGSLNIAAARSIAGVDIAQFNVQHDADNTGATIPTRAGFFSGIVAGTCTLAGVLSGNG
jgi:hypothetical protein